MRYAHIYTLFLMVVFCTSSKGQQKPSLPKQNIKQETKDHGYTDPIGKGLIIQNSFPKGGEKIHTMTHEKEGLYNYGLLVLNSFLDKGLQKAS